MAHVQSKSENKETSQPQVAKNTAQASNAVDEGGSWQFKFILGVIALGLLMLILKTVGLL